MNSLEKSEISMLPEKYRTLGAWSYFGYSILFALPLVGFILLIVFSFSNSNINRLSFARSYFCAWVILLVIVAIVVAVVVATAGMGAFTEFFNSLGKAK